VILQEVPRRCVWKLRRFGDLVSAGRPDTETFGENVGVLAREVFGLDIEHSGYHNLVRQSVEQKKDYDDVLRHFGNQLGDEARALTRAMLAAREVEVQ
jgi:hypothetical protein